MPEVSPAHIERIEGRRSALRRSLQGLLTGAAPFVFEVGCGHGHFLAAYAETFPDRLCLGIDVVLDRIERADRKRLRSALPNLRFMRAEVSDFLASLPDQARFREIYLLFPDPWPKRRHSKNRIMQSSFLENVAKISIPGCRLHFRTDDAAYFAEAEGAVRASKSWRLVDRPWPLEVVTVFQAKARSHQSFVAERAGD